MQCNDKNAKTQNEKEAQPTTHFGYQEVALQDKTRLVERVFHSVANQYDCMNDLMSLGLHRIWKYVAIQKAFLRPHQKILDLATGTGDLVRLIARSTNGQCEIIACDINDTMLQVGRRRLIDEGLITHIDFVQADAEYLPFKAHEFDCITMAFGLRNVTKKKAALKSMYLCLKPGGKVLILEFSHPHHPILSTLYELYSFKVIPTLGNLIAKDKASYQYLVESIRRHPNQIALKTMMEEAGFEDVEYINFLDGIVALHQGYKY